jgi:hypothetical protein
MKNDNNIPFLNNGLLKGEYLNEQFTRTQSITG